MGKVSAKAKAVAAALPKVRLPGAAASSDLPASLIPLGGEVDTSLVLPKPHLSYSAVSMYLLCSKQYEYRYIKDLKEPPAVSLEFGKSGHEALEFNNKYKHETGSDLKAKVVQEKFADEFTTRKKEIKNWDGEDQHTAYDKHIKIGKALVEKYMKDLAPGLTPEHEPEKEKNVVINGVPMKMYIDLTTKAVVNDYKFVKKAKSEKDVKNSLQLWIYGTVEKKSQGSFISLNKGNGGVVRHIQPITNRDKAWGAHIIKATAKAITAGVFFPRAPDGLDSWKCQPKFCGFWARCRGKSTGKFI